MLFISFAWMEICVLLEKEKIFCSTHVQMSRYGLLLVRCVDLYDGLYGGGLSETWKHVVASRWGKDECKYGTRRNSTCEITCRNLEYLLDFTIHPSI